MIFPVCLLSGCTGKKSESGDAAQDKISFARNELTIFVGEEMTIPVSYQKFDRGVYVKAEYDFTSNPLEIRFSSSTGNVGLSGDRIKGVSEGMAEIGMTSSKAKVSGTLSVTVKKKDSPAPSGFSQDLTQPLTSDMVYLPLGLQTGMQGLDIDSRGGCYMSTEENNTMTVCALNKDGSKIGGSMVLPSGGHGDGFSIEYGADEVYFWTSGTLGDHGENGGYAGGKATGSDVRLICRHKFKAGVTEYAEEAAECFYLNDNGCRIVDVDTEHDVMACWTYENSSDYMYVYKFSSIRTAKKITKTVSRSSHNPGKTVSVYDLNTITPIAKFPWKRKGVTTGDTNSGAVQGLCVYDDRIYVNSGAKNDEATLISVMDFKGNILQQLVKLGVSVDKQQLIKLNLSSDGTFEPEGMHIHQGQMYLGFVGDFPTSGSKKHSCIIKLK